MASNASDLERVFAVSWITKPQSQTTRSSNFLLMNAVWHLELSFSCGFRNPFIYTLTLLQGKEKRKLEKPLDVSVYFVINNVERQERLFNINETVNTTCEVIFSVQRNLQSEVKVGCIFHDATSPLTESGGSPDLESLTLDFSNLLKDSTLSDVKLRCGDDSISAHKTVLCARSEVFSAMFRSRMAENESGVVDVRDLDIEVFRPLLKYIYTADISTVTDEVIPSLYEAADVYAVHALKKTCSDRMVASLTEENYISMLSLADAHSDVHFKAGVIAFICRHEKILLSDVWSKFSKENAYLSNEVFLKFAQLKIQAN